MANSDDEPKPQPVAVKRESTLATLRDLWPYMWPPDRPRPEAPRGRRAGRPGRARRSSRCWCPTPTSGRPTRWSAPGRSGHGHRPRRRSCTVPIMLVVANGVGRILMNVFNNLRDALFAKVGQHAVRHARLQAPSSTCTSCRSAITCSGGRAACRGSSSAASTASRRSSASPSSTPCRRSSSSCSPRRSSPTSSTGRYSRVIAVTVVFYVWFTVKASDWRIRIRRSMNESDQDAHSKAIDSLLNFETVKYFGNETMEAARFDRRWRATSRRRSASGRRSPG